MPGDAFALLAALCWATANLTIARGARSSTDNGAFLSILLTGVLSGGAWLAFGGPAGLAAAAAVPAAWGWFGLAGLLSLFFGRVFLHASLHWLGAVRGSSIKRLAPVFSVVLAVVVLGEVLDMSLVLGMLLIFAAFGLLVAESRGSSPAPGTVGFGNPGLWYGVVSAFAYASGNIARKWGLEVLPDPALGVFVGALAGIAMYLLTALFADGYRQAVIRTFRSFNPWLLASGILASCGQLLFFVALDRSTVTRVTLLASSEVFITMALSAWIGTSRDRLTPAVWLAAGLSLAGTILLVAFR